MFIVLLVSVCEEMDLHNLRNGKRELVDLDKRVCLVGSSGVLLGKKKGEEIDKFPGKVVRMNGACAGGKYGEDVGNGCDIRVVCYNAVEQVWKWRKELGFGGGAEPIIVFWGADVHKKNAICTVGKLMRELGDVRFYELGRDYIRTYDQLFMKYVGVPRLASGAWLSTGWVTLCMLLGSGCGVSVYGMFGGGGQLYHYWDAGRGRDEDHYKDQQFGVKGHRFLTEHKVFVDIWTKLYKLEFIKL